MTAGETPQVFLLDAAQRPQRSFTVPEPPSVLAAERVEARAQRMAQLRGRVEAEALAECTFRPRTKEAANRELLQRILAEEEDGFRAGGGGEEDTQSFVSAEGY